MRGMTAVHAHRQSLAFVLCVVSLAFVTMVAAYPRAMGDTSVGISAVVAAGVVILDLVALATRDHR